MTSTSMPQSDAGCTTISVPFQHPYPQYINCISQSPDTSSTTTSSSFSSLASATVATAGTPSLDNAAARLWNSIDLMQQPLPALTISFPLHDYGTQTPAPGLLLPIDAYSPARDQTVLVSNTHFDLSGVWLLQLILLIAFAASYVAVKVLGRYYLPNLTDRNFADDRYWDDFLNGGRLGEAPSVGRCKHGQSHGLNSGFSSEPRLSSGSASTSKSTSTSNPALRQRPGIVTRPQDFYWELGQGQSLDDLLGQVERNADWSAGRSEDDAGDVRESPSVRNWYDRGASSHRDRPFTAPAGEPYRHLQESTPSLIASPNPGYVEMEEVEDMNGELGGSERESENQADDECSVEGRAQPNRRRYQVDGPGREDPFVYHLNTPEIAMDEVAIECLPAPSLDKRAKSDTFPNSRSCTPRRNSN